MLAKQVVGGFRNKRTVMSYCIMPTVQMWHPTVPCFLQFIDGKVTTALNLSKLEPDWCY